MVRPPRRGQGPNRPRGASAFGRFTRALQDVGANLGNRVQQARDAFLDLINRVSGGRGRGGGGGGDDEEERRENRRAFIRAYQQYGNELINRNVDFNRTYRDPNRQFDLVPRFAPNHIGRMFMYQYDPKHKATLPYYDTLPLILLLNIYNDGFLGMNLHYLPPRPRARLLDAIVDNEIGNRRLIRSDQTTIPFSYQIMQRAARSNLYRPCIKQYLFSHVRSGQFLEIPGSDWETMLFLPYDNFVKQDRRTVWRDSVRAGR